MNYEQLKLALMKLGIYEGNAEIIANHLGLDVHQRQAIEMVQGETEDEHRRSHEESV
jgi:hypothetical protein